MLKIPSHLLFDENSQCRHGENLAPGQHDSMCDEEISLTSIEDIEWVTRVIEPEQQRGPSENA